MTLFEKAKASLFSIIRLNVAKEWDASIADIESKVYREGEFTWGPNIQAFSTNYGFIITDDAPQKLIIDIYTGIAVREKDINIYQFKIYVKRDGQLESRAAEYFEKRMRGNILNGLRDLCSDDIKPIWTDGGLFDYDEKAYNYCKHDVEICKSYFKNTTPPITNKVYMTSSSIIPNALVNEQRNNANTDEDKKCINRGNVYKTMTDDQKIVMQDAIANAVESTIKDCRMEYEKALKAQQLKIENYKGLINSIYGANGPLAKIDQLKNSLEVQKIIINEPAMIVFWKDGTKTVVTATDEEFDEEKGLAMAYAKKWLGNNYAAGGRFKAKLKHAERVNKTEETVENDISKMPICKEIMDEAMRRVKAEMKSESAKEPAKKATSDKKKK